MDSTTYLSKRELAQLLSVSSRTLDNWIRTKKIASIKIGRLVRFNITRVQQDLQRFERKAVGQ